MNINQADVISTPSTVELVTNVCTRTSTTRHCFGVFMHCTPPMTESTTQTRANMYLNKHLYTNAQVRDATRLPEDIARITTDYVTSALPSFELGRYCGTCNRDFTEGRTEEEIKEGPKVYTDGYGGLCAPDDYEFKSRINLWERGYCGKTMCYGASHPGGWPGQPHWTPELPMPDPGPCMAIHSHVAIKCADCVKLNHLEDPDFNIFEVATRNLSHTYDPTIC